MKPRTWTALILISLSLLGLLAGTCTFLVSRINFNGRGPEHVFPLSGNQPLTEAQAVDFSRETLKLDGRFSSTLKYDAGRSAIQPAAGDSISLPLECSLSWIDSQTRQEWFVSLKHEKDRVIAVSYHGT